MPIVRARLFLAGSPRGDKAMNPEEAKEEIIHRTKQPFVDYLKGHEEKVQSGMNMMVRLPEEIQNNC